MNPTIYRYPLDGTGTSPDNLVKDEEHQLSNRTIRCVAPTYGGFFADSVVVVDAATNLPLEHGKNKDYIFGELLEFPTGRYEKEIFSLIVIKRPGVSKVKITYQALGGDYSYSMDAIIAMIDNLNLGERPVAWPDIIGKPPLFDPASHFHDLGDVYGFEYVVSALDRIRAAILLGDVASHDEIYRYVDRIDEENKALIAAVRGDLTTHVNNLLNPHQVTKAQVGLSNVQNYPVATQAIMDAGLGGAYLTPDISKAFIDHYVGGPLYDHINNTANPHNTTKTQVGLGLVNNYPMSSVSEMEAGGATDRYVSPVLVRNEINRLVLVPLTEHVNDRANPHQTTKTQIGLSNVDNYATANDQVAAEGISNAHFMTPRLVRGELQRLAITPLENHTNRSDNPHAVTKTQVGLGNVQNYPVANQENMNNGNGGAYLTPDVAKYYVDNAAIIPMQQHINNISNPHGVTKTQVGLSNLQNWAPVINGTDIEGAGATGYVTPKAIWEFTSKWAIAPINSHINNGNNPHGTTAAQVGLGNVSNLRVATQQEMADGLANVYTTADIVNNWVRAYTTPYQQHIGLTNNPHQVTKAQIGLSDVENYGIASVAQMDAAQVDNKVVSPYLVGRYVYNNAVLPLNNHVNNTNNPHQVTKAQIGLSNVQNYAMASDAEMDAGVSGTTYTSPAGVARYVAINAYQPLQAHVGNMGNPHQTTAAQVGLGNVSNFPVASAQEAQAGVNNDRYMTPALVRAWTEATWGTYFMGWKATTEDAVAGQRDDRWVSPYGMQQMVANRLSGYYSRAEVDWLINDVYNRSNNTVYTYGADVPVYQWSTAQGVINNAVNYFDVFPPQGKTMANIQAFTASNSFTQFNGDVDDNDTLRCQFAFQSDRIRVWTGDSEQRSAPRANWLAIWK